MITNGSSKNDISSNNHFDLLSEVINVSYNDHFDLMSEMINPTSETNSKWTDDADSTASTLL